MIEQMPGTEMPNAIIFDWDNTLVDSWPVIRDALNTTLTTFGHEPWSIQETRQRVKKSTRESFPGLFGSEWEKAVDVFYARYADIHADAIAPLRGVSEMLADIQSLGIYQCIVSNKRGDYLRKEAETLGWTSFFGQIVGANDAVRDKPASDPIHMALAGSNVLPAQNVWFVGDADIDMECALNTNCLPVLLRALPPEDGEFDRFPPHFHFNSAEALCKRLRKM